MFEEAGLESAPRGKQWRMAEIWAAAEDVESKPQEVSPVDEVVVVET